MAVIVRASFLENYGNNFISLQLQCLCVCFIDVDSIFKDAASCLAATEVNQKIIFHVLLENVSSIIVSKLPPLQ